MELFWHSNCFISLYVYLIELTCMCERPGSVYEEDVCCQQHDDDPMGKSDQTAAPLRPPLSEGTAEQQVEKEPANQAAGHLQYWHGCLSGTIGLISTS